MVHREILRIRLRVARRAAGRSGLSDRSSGRLDAGFVQSIGLACPITATAPRS